MTFLLSRWGKYFHREKIDVEIFDESSRFEVPRVGKSGF